ncbi:MAG: isoprenylcysteine carboxylmethyltransferase family protein [Alphaproteobacteria bacterium]|jgi:protein-S-isoprenylcysteine O-methyltransferase Ste14|nr:isoprenylcysteine carboxylmethyltransferase family protein [Rhodospirillaceae bacterium]MBT6205583.1 isoprenylcysteine carboxylmethyltransferase family protein [Rhodospirillaceae bacterium]MBT6509669.1 isoprenylcysteine carboxylmethyltransferase family protein [Rhodospirillaceae bacterium]MBT7646235.1 isoprenylcysteine carboxylmethyltransferase family protein [Rhodospirillaceae bacterium]MDG2479738.1 isoprenylcysteine carboxylmethyltransferase family protein [Alphaproteobacteria bacterium]
MTEEPRNAGVIAPPPIIVLVALLAGVELDALLPAPFLGPVVQTVLGVAFIVPGVALAFWAIRRFRKSGTEVEPWKPNTALVIEGPYRFTRNPMYLALALLFAGLGFAIDTLWLFALLPLLVATLHYGVIRREEHYLEGLFGEPYRDYCTKVRRWI